MGKVVGGGFFEMVRYKLRGYLGRSLWVMLLFREKFMDYMIVRREFIR